MQSIYHLPYLGGGDEAHRHSEAGGGGDDAHRDRGAGETVLIAIAMSDLSSTTVHISGINDLCQYSGKVT